MAIRTYSDEDYEVASLVADDMGVSCSVVTCVDEATQLEYELLKFGEYYWPVVQHLFTRLYKALGYTRPIPMRADKVAKAFGTQPYFYQWRDRDGQVCDSLMVGPFPWADIADLFDEFYVDDAADDDKPNTLTDGAREVLVDEMEIGDQLQIIEDLTNDEWSSPHKSLQTLKLELFDTIRCFYNAQLHSYLQNYDPTLRWACDLAAGCPFADKTCAFCDAASEPFDDDPAWESSASSPSSDGAVDAFASGDSTFHKADAASGETSSDSRELYRGLKEDLESLSESDRALIDPAFVDSLIASLADLAGESSDDFASGDSTVDAADSIDIPANFQIDPTSDNPNATSNDGGNRIRGDPPKGGDAHPPNTAENND